MKSLRIRPIQYYVKGFDSYSEKPSKTVLYGHRFENDGLDYIEVGLQHMNAHYDDFLCFFLFLSCKETRTLFLIDGFGRVIDGMYMDYTYFENITHMKNNKQTHAVLEEILFPTMLKLFACEGFDKTCIYNKGYFNALAKQCIKQTRESMAQLYSSLPSLAITAILKRVLPDWVFFCNTKWKKPKYASFLDRMDYEHHFKRWIGSENYEIGLRDENEHYGVYVRVLYRSS